MNKIPSQNPVLKDYLADVAAWHGYVRFLGLPTYQNSPDVPIEELYVPHAIASENFPPESAPATWKTIDPTLKLAEEKRLLILGDPGSGKSTLVNWFAWYLASGFSKRLPEPISDLLPLPLIVRDLSLARIEGFEALIDAFLSRPVARALADKREVLFSYLKAGQVLLLVDGLDEVAPAVGSSVLAAISEGLQNYDCFALCTSRIVGYEEIRAALSSPRTRRAQFEQAVSSKTAVATEAKRQVIDAGDGAALPVYYVAPFDDSQISRFALNWYRDQGGNDREARSVRDEFISAIRSDPSTLRLARTPNLLTMMALIYRVRARLPSGRALLYEDISQAYLESIDTARRLKDEFSWQSKKQWLARVAFEMQIRRVESSGSADRASTDLLVGRDEVISWINAAISESGEEVSDGYAQKYLDWITKRSGLLLPRGEGLFAFLHLSFQEYFAALYIRQQLMVPGWTSGEAEETEFDNRVSVGGLSEWPGSPAWHQCLVFLFELMAGEKSWPKALVKLCFPSGWATLSEELSDSEVTRVVTRARLFLDVLANPHGGFQEKARDSVIGACASIVLAEQAWLARNIDRLRWRGARTLLSRVLASSVLQPYGFQWLQDNADEVRSLALEGLSAESQVRMLEFLRELPQLECLSLNGLNLGSLSFLRPLTKISTLSLNGAKFVDHDIIGELTALKNVYLDDANIRDAGFLSRLTEMHHLTLNSNPISDIGPLASLRKLAALELDGTEIRSLHGVDKLRRLELLSVAGTEVNDLGPLQGLKKVAFLTIGHTRVTSLKPLAGIESLVWLDISKLRLKSLAAVGECQHLRYLWASSIPPLSLTPLRKLRALTHLWLDDSAVQDISPISSCRLLEVLSLRDTNVTSLEPLRELGELKSLELDGLQVTDLEPLSKMSKLERLSIKRTSVVDVSPLVGLPKLTRVAVSGSTIHSLDLIKGVNLVQHIHSAA
ncbi:NACHT domain-containing protein [Cognatilysobacter bugurensis]|uniref:NACHT domain-containing protein n=1 Tax=Cognatilysobacter bugurensis TaxID=543356 RepID=A0A918SZA0_9GAMM|nr:NACHT domain-containing protein [Lysobacter bugurensis]GHA78735.1 hypothetical protein GCM10007067_15130 [Lysobacter bugurensis]